MDSPRRSARLARNQPSSSSNQVQSRFSSLATSSFPSPENVMNTTGFHQSQSQQSLGIPSSYLPVPRGPNSMEAPLPSPSTAEINPFAARPHSHPNIMSASLQSNGLGMASQGQSSFMPQQQQQQQQQSTGIPHSGPGPLPPNFDVLAEAAKRAQIACLMRDFGDVSL